VPLHRCPLVIGCLLGAITACRSNKSNDKHDQAKRLEQLQALPYLDTVPTHDDPQRSGQTLNKGVTGYYLYSPLDENRAVLRDETGAKLHEWSADEEPGTANKGILNAGWHVTALDAQGDLLVVRFHQLLMKLDRRSQVKWKLQQGAHHDLELTKDGRILTLLDDVGRLPNVAFPVFLERVAHVSSAGAIEQQWSVIDILMSEPKLRALVERAIAERAKLFAELPDDLAQWKTVGQVSGWAQELQQRGCEPTKTALLACMTKLPPHDARRLMWSISERINVADVLHVNDIAVAPAANPPFWQAGDFMVSVRNLNTLVVFDPKTRRVRWHWGADVVEHQHHPALLAGGTILLFDNGIQRKRSRIIEYDPKSDKIVWSYEPADAKRLFTGFGGSVQKLPDGNVLVTESQRARMLEINKAGDIVWEYVHPNDGKNPRGAVYRATKIPADHPFIKSLKADAGKP
jgi:hypothetical protein